jgi:hypothetical protein
VLEARLRPGTEFERLTDELDAHIRDALQRFLEARRAELPGVDPARAATVGMLMLDATTREAAFFANPRGAPLAVERTTLRRELVRAYVAYLRAG